MKGAKAVDKTVESYKKSKLINNKGSKFFQLDKPNKLGTIERASGTVLDETGVTAAIDKIGEDDAKKRKK